ncbi:exopolysaccharide biosynthesis polyprenyl glycosylphosphotransferase [Flavobacterium agrisoli]|uniref:Exopolysaccharide biosynthesis polyprenyl glycosylphosphotransferase n=1 Tax=Flavobacterium agrisoli TaxID=2793066 RepID=A0A934UIQ0_9FLAO|nr:exopolysaccharide biosynthesis polyprenyl glycosylphosphotransferase [Flavobacterium agrisoli]MBK0368789.1 exopolysaccharide biosynthesis polyprenyl glycosylphosphotransferase [Flavobacterium agrisoli]
MRNRHKFSFIISCAILDMLAMVLGTVLFLEFANEEKIGLSDLLFDKMIPITILSWLFTVSYFQLYKIDVLFNLDYFFQNSWRAFFTQRILWHSYLFVFQDNVLYFFGSKANLIQLSFLFSYFLFSRILFTIVISRIKFWVFKPFTVGIWGFNKTSIELAAHLESNSYFIDFVGIVNENENVEIGSIEKFTEALSEAIHKASESGINELYIVAKPDFINDLNYFFELGDKHCMRLKFVPDFSSISKKHFNSTHLNNFHVIKPRYEPLQNAYNRLAKRVFDLAFSSLVIVFILSWLYPLLAFIIKKQSKGPVLFKQLRTGKKNEPFWCYKFRSMYTDMGDETEQAKRGDSRITPIGKFIRRTSLDEMPQFFNVLMGKMSVVGPRPHMIKHTSDYNGHINNFMVRHFVKPGITGLAQVSGLRGETKRVVDMKRRVTTDIEYVQRWSLIKDLKICILTVVITLKGDKNAF